MKIPVHTFNLGDVDDVDIYAAGPIYEWQKTDAGKWVMERSKPEPYWTIGFDHLSYGHRVTIIANLEDADATYYNLKWGIK